MNSTAAASDYYRNSDQEARDPFTNKPGVPLAAATWKQFGGSVGGPIIKDKLFFFGDYQGTKQQQGITNLYTTPSAEVLKTCNPATNTTGFCDMSEYLTVFGATAGQIFDPLTGNQQTGVGRTAFPNNMIPIARIKQNVGVGNVLALFPAPTVSCGATPTTACLSNNFVSTGAGPFDQKSFDTRIDYSAPPITFRYSAASASTTFPCLVQADLAPWVVSALVPAGLNGSSINHDYSLAAGFTKAIGAKWLTDFRFGYFKYNPQTHYSDATQSPMDKLGFPGLNSGTGIVGPPTTRRPLRVPVPAERWI